MATEIERKFLVDAEKIRGVKFSEEINITQGYLSRVPVVRIRLTDNRAMLTIKSATVGITRSEFEYEIPQADAEQLLQLCGEDVLKKCRRKIFHGGYLWEVDFFGGKLEGLILAEVELKSADENVELPDWILREVSNDSRYFNSNLIALSSKELLP
ncbi:MAG: CYTH domain-containing protein [Selenomonadaceae bacterium]|nr:CYTH domain-containing protein [Selenomonadaceae bacterium]